MGLIEIENDENDAAKMNLVNALNVATAPGTYDYLATGYVGGDAIQVALIFKPSTVSLVGNFAILDSSFNPDFIDDKNRPVLFQTFEESSSGALLTVGVHHLKSKGSPCDAPDDATDGSGNCDGTRTKAAKVIVEYLATDPTNSGDPDFLLIGDFNA